MPKHKLSPVVSRYFDAWICRDTWDSHHPLDTEQFYRFVKAVAKYNRQKPLPATIHAAIMNRWKGRRSHRQLKEKADHFSELYAVLLDYERTKGFPDALIERRDIVKFHLKLSGRSGALYTSMMTKAWGRDWKNKLEKALSG